MVSFTSEILIENTQPRPALAPAKPDDQDHKMRCLEVWGGNTPVDNGVVMPGLDAWVYSRPHNGSEHGGDVYYVSSCVCGYMTRLLLADVSGHGESAAKEANKLRYLMRKHVNSCDQSAFVSKLNNAFSGVSDGAGFATAVAATYLAVENILIVCNAGQPAPLWYRAKTDTWQQLDLDAAMRALNEEDDPSNLPLGVVDGTKYEQSSVKLKRGDIVIFHTDSLMEARSKDGEMLGQNGLLEIVNSINSRDPEQLMRELLDRIRDFRDDCPADDDLSVIMVRQNGTAPPMSIKEKFINNIRMARMILFGLLPGGGPISWPNHNIR